MRIDQVVGADAAGILNQPGSLVLAVAEARAAPVVVASPWGNLHFEERHLLGGAAKLRAPEVDHRLEALRIGVVLAHVRLALIPQESSHRVVAQGMQHAVVHDTGRVVVPPLPVPALLLLLLHVDVAVLRDDALGQPALHARTTPGTGDDAHGHLQRALQHRGKEPTRGAEPRSSLGRSHLPLARHLLHNLGLAVLRNGRHAHVAMFGSRGDGLVAALYGTVPETVERHFHVRLPRSKPHLADEHAREHHLVGRLLAVGFLNDKRVLVVGSGRRAHREQPPAVAVGTGRELVARPADGCGNRRLRCSLAPQAGVGLLLQHHVVAKDFRQLNLCRRHQGQHHSHKKHQQFFHHIPFFN